jgi:hypothetical protein
LFDRLDVNKRARGATRSRLIVGGGGRVGIDHGPNRTSLTDLTIEGASVGARARRTADDGTRRCDAMAVADRGLRRHRSDLYAVRERRRARANVCRHPRGCDTRRNLTLRRPHPQAARVQTGGPSSLENLYARELLQHAFGVRQPECRPSSISLAESDPQGKAFRVGENVRAPVMAGALGRAVTLLSALAAVIDVKRGFQLGVPGIFFLCDRKIPRPGRNVDSPRLILRRRNRHTRTIRCAGRRHHDGH